MGKVLVVVDMQRDFINGALPATQAEGQDVVANVVKKVEEEMNLGTQIVFTMDTHGENYLATQEGRNLPVEHCIKGTEGWKLVDELESYLDSAKWFMKDTFGSVELAEYIRSKNLVHNYEGDELKVELVGVCTDICVVSNALLIKAFCPELEVSVDAKCCAGVTLESHKAALNTLKMCQVTVKNDEEEDGKVVEETKDTTEPDCNGKVVIVDALKCPKCGNLYNKNCKDTKCWKCGTPAEKFEESSAEMARFNEYGVWRVHTEADCEGKSIKKLGVFKGKVTDIALHLKNEAYYRLDFTRVKENKDLEILEVSTIDEVPERPVWITLAELNSQTYKCSQSLIMKIYGQLLDDTKVRAY